MTKQTREAFRRLSLAHLCRKYMRFSANIRKRRILAPKTLRPEVTYNVPPLISLYHALDPKCSVETGFQCISKAHCIQHVEAIRQPVMGQVWSINFQNHMKPWSGLIQYVFLHHAVKMGSFLPDQGWIWFCIYHVLLVTYYMKNHQKYNCVE